MHTPGKYEAVLSYTCAEADVGSTVELTFGKASVRAKVSEAHDPPLVGAEDDRVPRGHESYVKDFAPLPLGTIELPAGRGTLVLKALSVPGRQVMDLRSLRLTLVE